MNEFARLASNRDARLDEHSVITEEERDRLLIDWNRTRIEFDRDKCVHQLFEQQVSRTPSKTAAIFHDRALSYEEMNVRSDRLAAYLRKSHDVGPDTVVALCMTSSLEMIVALVAILKAGGAYLPVDPAFPTERISFMLRESRATVILTQQALIDAFKAERITPVVVDDDFESVESDRQVAVKVTPKDLAYLMFTSGSTGTPKGVMVEHRNVVNCFAGMDHVLGTEPGVWLAVTSASFDISVLELLWTLTHGFTVILQGEAEKLITDGQYSTASQLRRHQITHLQCTPTLARTLIRLPGALLAMKSLRKLLLGGEPLPSTLANLLFKELPAEIYNMYGPTETTIWSTAFKIETVQQDVVPIGKPIANTSIYLLDQQRCLVPFGAIGELYIGGEGVTRGYWNRLELTAERFILSPFSKDPADRLYKTGDLARYRADGTIEFHGRIDQQVKIRGVRVELGEIENVLGAHPAVREVVVIVSETTTAHQQLVACVVSNASDRVNLQQLQNHARRKLPEYMIPTALLCLENLPVTPNGKVDRKALTAFKLDKEVTRTNESDSNSDLETKICQVWQDALGIDTIGLHDNFFDLGANSLVLAEVVVDLKGIGKCELLLVDLFTYPTVSTLAAYANCDVDYRNLTHGGSERGALRLAALEKNGRNVKRSG
jgi:amino acid adenylation domain-containing protein